MLSSRWTYDLTPPSTRKTKQTQTKQQQSKKREKKKKKGERESNLLTFSLKKTLDIKDYKHLFLLFVSWKFSCGWKHCQSSIDESLPLQNNESFQGTYLIWLTWYLEVTKWTRAPFYWCLLWTQKVVPAGKSLPIAMTKSPTWCGTKAVSNYLLPDLLR